MGLCSLSCVYEQNVDRWMRNRSVTQALYLYVTVSSDVSLVSWECRKSEY